MIVMSRRLLLVWRNDDSSNTSAHDRRRDLRRSTSANGLATCRVFSVSNSSGGDDDEALDVNKRSNRRSLERERTPRKKVISAMAAERMIFGRSRAAYAKA